MPQPDNDLDDVGEYASPACLMHEFKEEYFAASVAAESGQALRHGGATRLVPERALPPYAYLPGRSLPHPVRHPAGHSYGVEDAGRPSADIFAWGVDLFNAGFYWEAHEAWEPLWRRADPGCAHRAILKALILLAAAGVKLRRGKIVAAGRHARRADHQLSGALTASMQSDSCAWVEKLLVQVKAVALQPGVADPRPETSHVVFSFSLGPAEGLFWATDNGSAVDRPMSVGPRQR